MTLLKKYLGVEFSRRLLALRDGLGNFRPQQSSVEPAELFPEFQKLKSELFEKKEIPECFYLGDSVLLRTAREDVDNRCLGQLFCDELSSVLSSCWVAHSAYHMEVYYHLIRFIIKHTETPPLIVLPINLRSFSPQWQYYPDYQFRQEIAFLQAAFEGREDYSVFSGEIDIDSNDAFEEYDQHPVDSLSTLTKIGEFRLLINAEPKTAAQKQFRYRQIFMLHYLCKLREMNERLRYLTFILNETHQSQSKILIYLTPANYQAGVRFVGSEFERIVAQNVGIIENVISKHKGGSDVVFLDEARSFASNLFFQEDNATEHLNEAGRKKMASILVNHVKLVKSHSCHSM